MPDDKQKPLFPINQLRKQLEKEVEKFNQLASHIHNPHNPELRAQYPYKNRISAHRKADRVINIFRARS